MGDGMASARFSPETLEERIVYWSITGTWLIWLSGGLYILAPSVGWTLAAIATTRRLGLNKNVHRRDTRPLAICSVVWIAGMALMAVTLLAGHIDFDLGAGQTLKSLIGWMKGWALLAVFIYVGAAMRIRPAIIYRATNVLAAQTLALAPILLAAAFLHLPRQLYVSPLQAVGGPGPEFFAVELYGIEPETGVARWRFFAPWAPAAALIANISLALAIYDRSRFWKAIGIVSSLVVCIMSQSRMGLIAVPVVAVVVLMVSSLSKPVPFAVGAVLCTMLVPLWTPVSQVASDAILRFQNARASSSRVRATLQRIALHRWWNEAPVFGHGTVERGPHLVEYMPIGSHHTWNGLLYVKGFVGVLALAGPVVWTLIELAIRAQSDRTARCALSVMLLLTFYSFGENLEILVYLIWPGLIVVGVATGRRLISPFHRLLGNARLAGVSVPF
jgi:hypothetical protein